MFPTKSVDHLTKLPVLGMRNPPFMLLVMAVQLSSKVIWASAFALGGNTEVKVKSKLLNMQRISETRLRSPELKLTWNPPSCYLAIMVPNSAMEAAMAGKPSTDSLTSDIYEQYFYHGRYPLRSSNKTSILVVTNS